VAALINTNTNYGKLPTTKKIKFAHWAKLGSQGDFCRFLAAALEKLFSNHYFYKFSINWTSKVFIVRIVQFWLTEGE